MWVYCGQCWPWHIWLKGLAVAGMLVGSISSWCSRLRGLAATAMYVMVDGPASPPFLRQELFWWGDSPVGSPTTCSGAIITLEGCWCWPHIPVWHGGVGSTVKGYLPGWEVWMRWGCRGILVWVEQCYPVEWKMSGQVPIGIGTARLKEGQKKNGTYKHFHSQRTFL